MSMDFINDAAGYVKTVQTVGITCKRLILAFRRWAIEVVPQDLD